MITCPPGASRLGPCLSAIVLALLSAYAALVAVGGITVLYRDSCEERSLPYSPTHRVNGSSSDDGGDPTFRQIGRTVASRRDGKCEVLPEILARSTHEVAWKGCRSCRRWQRTATPLSGSSARRQGLGIAHGTGLRRVDRAVLLENSGVTATATVVARRPLSADLEGGLC